MNRLLQIVAVLLSLGPPSGLAERSGGLKLVNDSGLNNTSAGLSYSLTNDQEIDSRQSVSVHNAGENDSRWRGGTRGRYDFHYGDVEFGSSKLRPFVGANADYIYGSNVDDSLMAGPEAGLKVDVQSTTLVLVKTEYQSLYQAGDQIDEALNDGSFTYSLGVELRF